MGNAGPQVKTYKNSKEFEKDAKKMFAKGYTVAGQSADGNQHLTATRLVLLGPLALFAKKGGKQVTVTWIPTPK